MSTATTRTPSAHALESRASAPAPVRHPLRPVPRRPLRKPHENRAGSTAGAPLVAPTALPEHAGDLLGLPDLRNARRALGRALAWLRESFEAAGAVEARLRARRDEDDARLARSGGSPTRLF